MRRGSPCVVGAAEAARKAVAVGTLLWLCSGALAQDPALAAQGSDQASQEQNKQKCSVRKMVAKLPSKARVLRGLKSTKGAKLEFESCAVMGNSGNLQGTHFGDAIDAHDAVIRMNQAPTQGYERFVGSKATFRIINKEWVRKYSDGVRWLPQEQGLALISRGDKEIRLGRGKFACALCVPDLRKKAERWSSRSHIPFYQFDQSLVIQSWRILSSFIPCSPVPAKKCPGCKPSSGILGIMMAVALCKNVTVYGMSGSNRGLRKGGQWPYHYYKFKGTELQNGYSGHMFSIEHELVVRMSQEGLLTMCGPDDAKICLEPSARDPCCQRDSPLAGAPDGQPQAVDGNNAGALGAGSSRRL